jgi:antitoxin component YwqK of YwqJK toxin-antitoxin module
MKKIKLLTIIFISLCHLAIGSGYLEVASDTLIYRDSLTAVNTDSLYVEYYAEGKQLKKFGKFVNGEQDGKWFYLFENGDTNVISYFKNGILDSTILYYKGNKRASKMLWLNQRFCQKLDCIDESGNNLYPGSMLNGTGSLYEYYPHGNISAITNYLDGYYDGERIFVNPDGSIKEIAIWKLGIIQQRIIYDNKGRAASRLFYEEGILIRVEDYYVRGRAKGKVKRIWHQVGDTILSVKFFSKKQHLRKSYE